MLWRSKIWTDRHTANVVSSHQSEKACRTLATDTRLRIHAEAHQEAAQPHQHSHQESQGAQMGLKASRSLPALPRLLLTPGC